MARKRTGDKSNHFAMRFARCGNFEEPLAVGVGAHRR